MKRIYVALGIAFVCFFAYIGAARAGCNYTVANGTCSNNVYGTSDSTIAGGANNIANATADTVGGGIHNYTDTNYATVCGGGYNSASSQESTIAGGYDNSIGSSSDGSTICGGYVNEISTYAYYSLIAGGEYNSIGTECEWDVIGGGDGNAITNEADYATIGGGYTNNATGEYGTVPGGLSNTAAGYASFAAGSYADADQNNCFVWSDGNEGTTSPHYQQNCQLGTSVTNAAPNAFVVRATGGIQFVTQINADGSPNSGFYVSPGVNSLNWFGMSDENVKHDIVEVEPREVLERVVSMPVATWRYNRDKNGPLHMGPMAQDFYAAFELGGSDHSIEILDEAGVALAAIKGLHDENLRLSERVAALEQANAEANVEANRRVASLEQANVEANCRAALLESRLEKIEAQLALRK